MAAGATTAEQFLVNRRKYDVSKARIVSRKRVSTAVQTGEQIAHVAKRERRETAVHVLKEVAKMKM